MSRRCVSRRTPRPTRSRSPAMRPGASARSSGSSRKIDCGETCAPRFAAGTVVTLWVRTCSTRPSSGGAATAAARTRPVSCRCPRTARSPPRSRSARRSAWSWRRSVSAPSGLRSGTSRAGPTPRATWRSRPERWSSSAPWRRAGRSSTAGAVTASALRGPGLRIRRVPRPPVANTLAKPTRSAWPSHGDHRARSVTPTASLRSRRRCGDVLEAPVHRPPQPLEDRHHLVRAR